MAETHSLTESQIPERRSQSPSADILADLIAQDATSMQANIEGMNSSTLRGGTACTEGQRERERSRTRYG